MQLQEGARRFSRTRTVRSRSAVDAGVRRLYHAARLMPRPMRPLFRPLWQVLLSWFAPTEPTRVIVGNPGYRQRLIYTFENLG